MIPTVIPSIAPIIVTPSAEPPAPGKVESIPAPARTEPDAGLPDLSKAGSLDEAIGLALEAAEAKTRAAKTAPPVVEPPAAEPVKKEDPGVVSPFADKDDAALDQEITETTKAFDPKARNAFKELRYQHRDLTRKVKGMAELQAKLDEAVKKAGAPVEALETLQKDLTEVRAKYEAAEKELSVARLEGTDYFKAKIGQPLSDLEIALEGVAKSYELKESEIKSAMALTGRGKAKALSELAQGMEESDRHLFYEMVAQYANLQQARKAALEDAKNTYEQLQASEKEKAAREQTARREQWGAAAKATWEQVVSEVPSLAQATGNPEWDSALDTAKKFAETVDFGELDLPSQAVVMHRGGAWPVLVGENRGLKRENEQLKLQIAELRGASPSAGPGGSPPERKPAGAVTDDMSLEDAISARLAEHGIR